MIGASFKRLPCPMLDQGRVVWKVAATTNVS